MPTEDYSLRWLLHPVTPEEFFRDYWEAKPLVINRCRADYFQSLLSIEEIDHVITTLNLRFPEIKLVNAEREVTHDQYTLSHDRVDVAELYRLFHDGATIILNQQHSRVASLAAFCRAMEQDFSFPFQTNIYLTPGNAKGFKPHYDAHDVLILQVAGSKHWNIYQTLIELPLNGQEFDSALHQPGETTMEFDLQAGDTAFIPRGAMHDAQSNDEISLHITVGVMSYTWTDLLLEMFSAVSLNDPAFRKTLPVGFAHPKFDRAEARQLFRQLLRRFEAAADFDTTLDSFIDEFTSTRQPLLRGQMAQLKNLEGLSLESIVGARRGLIYTLHENGETMRVRCYGRELALPAYASESVRFALDTQRFAIHALPGQLDDAGKLVLIRRLIREGLVMLL